MGFGGGGGSTTKVVVPGPSPAQDALAQQQVSLLQQQRDMLSQQIQQQNLLAPLLFKSSGILPITDANGRTVGYAQQTDPLQDQGRQIQAQLNQRTLQALSGKLPDNPALLSDLAKQEDTLNEQLRKQLGPGYQVSTPGSTTLSLFGREKQNIIEAARRGDLTTAQALGISQNQANQQTLNNMLQRGAGISGFQFGNPGLGLAQAFTQAQNPFLAQQGMGLGANALNAQLHNQNLMALMSGAGNLAGLGLFAPSFSGTSGEATNIFGKLFSGGSSLFGGGGGGGSSAILTGL